MISISVSVSASGSVDESAVPGLRAKVDELKKALQAAGIASPWASFSPEASPSTSAPAGTAQAP